MINKGACLLKKKLSENMREIEKLKKWKCLHLELND
jgi:hypothetical protein